MTEIELRIYKDRDALSRAAAEEFISRATEAIAARNRFTVALAGGETPRTLYNLLASADKRDRVDWTRTHVFWGDERCVSPDDEESNYRMAQTALLSKVSIPPKNVHRIEAEREDKAASDYEDELQKFFESNDGEAPRFDLVLLGMGADGHTASLFPGSSAVEERRRLVVTTRSAASPTNRITLTLPVLNNALSCMFLVSGKEKAGVLQAIFAAEQAQETNFPAQLVNPNQGRLLWLVDEAAAGFLKDEKSSPRLASIKRCGSV
ncbi:MAG: 6-phosphogluconolactonase [Pyrinomonadaceae bacterium]|nr:6-phosphogluconolactonase [Pyrinomonadaceae bacterium]